MAEGGDPEEEMREAFAVFDKDGRLVVAVNKEMKT